MPVVRHSYGQFCESWQTESVINTLLESRYPGKIRLDHGIIVRVGSHPHQAAKADVRIFTSQYPFNFRFGETAFCLLRPEVEFKKDIRSTVIQFAPVLHCIQQMA